MFACVDPVIESEDVAVSVVDPVAIALTSPVELTVTLVLSELDHRTCVVKS